jgi:hypothetical protein
MKVDAPGLVAAAQRLITALEVVGGSGVPHPPLGADPASLGAAQRLTTAGAELTAALTAHVLALVASVEHLTGAAFTYLDADDQNAAAIAALRGGVATGVSGLGSAPPAPPLPVDVRAAMPPPAVGLLPEVISAGVHSGTPGAGEGFVSAWSQVAGAARNSSATIRSAVTQLPDILDSPVSTPAVSRHLLSFADGLDSYAERAHNLANQANAYASNLIQARADIPTPQELTAAENRVRTIAAANAASGGIHAAALANAISVKNQLNESAVIGYPPYHARTDADTAGDEQDTAGQGLPADPTTGDPGATGPGSPDPGAADPIAAGLSPASGDQMASLLPQLVPTLLGAAGGLVGGVMGAVTKVPESLMQAGSQALGAATQGLSGLGHPKTDSPGSGASSPDSGGDPTGAGGGGDAPTTPAAGDGAPDLPVAPSTGAPPTPAIAPVGATEGPGAGGAPAGASGVSPMGMPIGGLGGAPGGAGGAEGKGEVGRKRKVVVEDIPHTEDVTGRVDTDRLAAAAAANRRDRNTEPPHDDGPPDSAPPVVRRLVTRKLGEPS